MGVKGLWDILEPVKQTASFKGLAVVEGFGRTYRDYPMLRIGVDVSIWIASCEAGARSGSLHSPNENAALKIFLYRLCRLLTIPATFIFVFNGPNRPLRKRGVSVVNRPSWVTDYLKPLIANFGFYHHQAPGEAEAELAELNRRQYIDAILTEDSDVVVFGGLNIFRCLPNSDHYNELRVYYADMIHNADEVRLSAGGLILYALCAGGDYSDGLSDCGPETALAIARLNFGDTLLQAFETLGEGPPLNDFLVIWRTKLQDVLRNNPDHVLPRRRPSLADSITDNFPDIHVLALYRFPITTWPAPLAQFCRERFRWDSATVARRFREKLWPGIAIRLFTFVGPILVLPAISLSPFMLARIIKVSGEVPSSDGRLTAVKLRLCTRGFIDIMGPQWLSHSSTLRPITVEIPHLIFDAVVSSIPLIGVSTADAPSAQGAGTSQNPIELSDDDTDVIEVAQSLYICNDNVVDLTLD
ncbi:hypothetical protein EYR38_001708 [Pleurotus pulmonarius]|nr:hypothetical protein EYR38_001708 [Pleurotus pulmonarius]